MKIGILLIVVSFLVVVVIILVIVFFKGVEELIIKGKFIFFWGWDLVWWNFCGFIKCICVFF